MSGRIRTIKPELLEDAVTAGLSDMGFRLFIAMILLADDYGRLRAEPSWLMGQIYWARTVQAEDFLAAVAELEKLVRSYTVNGQRYAEIRNWSKHQKVSHPGKPRIPAPPETLPPPAPPPPEAHTRPSGGSPEALVPDHRPGTTDQGPPTTDQGPPTTDRGPPGEPEPPRAGRRFDQGTAAAAEAREAYAAAVTAAVGHVFAFPRAPFHVGDLCDVLNRHGPSEGIPAALVWLAETVTAWVQACDGKSSAGWQPSKLMDWLNGGRAPRRASTSRLRADTRQPLRDPNPEWLRTGGGDL